MPWLDIRRHVGTSNTGLLWAVRFGVVLLFFTPLIVTTDTVFPFIVGKAVWSRSLIEIIAGLYVLLAIRAPEFRPTRSRLVFLLGLHVVAMFVAGVFGSSFNLSFWSSYERMGGIFDLAHWGALAAVIVFTIRGLREWKNFVSISLVFGLAAAFLGLSEKYDFQIVGYLQGADRISGAAGNPSFLAGHMMINATLALALLGDSLTSLRRRRDPARVALAAFYSFSVVMSVWILIETGTRGSVFGLLSGIVAMTAIYAVFSGRPRIRISLAVVGAAVPVAVIVMFLARDSALVEDLASRNQLVDRVVSLSLDSGSDGLRVKVLRIAGEAFIARPVSGWGGENFEVPYQLYQREGEIPPGTPVLDRAHNKPLDLLATTGLIGFVTYMAVWGWMGVLAWRRVRDARGDRVFHAAVTGALVALFIHNLFLFDTAVTLLMFAFFAVWAAAGERTAPDEESAGFRMSWLRLPVGVGQSLGWVVPVLVGLIVFAGVYGVNWRTYQAAQLITETGATVEEVVDNLDHFSPLATFGRERLLNVMTGRWEELDPFERLGLITELGEQVDKALAAEPDNMELHFAVARFYRTAAVDWPELMERARFHTGRGVKLGPQTLSAARATAAQSAADAVADGRVRFDGWASSVTDSGFGG